MCSVGDDNLEENNSKYMTKVKEKIILDSDKCNKCRTEKPCVVLRNKDCYCRTCFLAGTMHKFKSILGKHRLLRPNDKVLVHHKAGQPSAALLHFLRSGLDLTTPKKLQFEPIFLYIDDQFYLTEDERRSLSLQVEKQIHDYGFRLFFVSLAQYAGKPEIANCLVDSPEKFKFTDNLNEFIDKKCNETNENDILENFRRQVLLDAAKHLGCKFVFSPNMAIDVASSILTNIALGRGQHVSVDTGFCDTRDPDVSILRPLRQFEMNELTMYNFLNNVEPVSVREYKPDPYSSVQTLMEKFVTDLQINYPATVTTIVKTGDKLAMDKKLDSSVVCQFCKAPVESKSEELCSDESTKFSHWISTQVPDYSLSPQERYAKLLEGFQNEDCDNCCFACKKLLNYIKHF